MKAYMYMYTETAFYFGLYRTVLREIWYIVVFGVAV